MRVEQVWIVFEGDKPLTAHATVEEARRAAVVSVRNARVREIVHIRSAALDRARSYPPVSDSGIPVYSTSLSQEGIKGIATVVGKDSRMDEKYRADAVRALVQDKRAVWLDHHACSVCSHMLGYSFDGDGVAFHQVCRCGGSPRQSSYYEIEKHLEMQTSDEVRDQILARLHTSHRGYSSGWTATVVDKEG